MSNHGWMDDVLRDIIAYATLNNMPHVARHVALGLDALHLHVYEEERRAARILLAMKTFDAQGPVVEEVPESSHSVLWLESSPAEQRAMS